MILSRCGAGSCIFCQSTASHGMGTSACFLVYPFDSQVMPHVSLCNITCEGQRSKQLPALHGLYQCPRRCGVPATPCIPRLINFAGHLRRKRSSYTPLQLQGLAPPSSGCKPRPHTCPRVPRAATPSPPNASARQDDGSSASRGTTASRRSRCDSPNHNLSTMHATAS